MAGHSKWANIQHRKSRQDEKRGKLFTRVIRELTVAARTGGGDPAMNPKLRLAMDKASDANMPKETVQRAIAKGVGGLEGDNFEEIRYEGYGPGGVALIVEALTDNRNRTATNVRTAFSKNGGNMAATGAVSHGFERMGMIEYPACAGDEDKIMEAAIEAGAEQARSQCVELQADGGIAATGQEEGRRLRQQVQPAERDEIGDPFPAAATEIAKQRSGAQLYERALCA